MLGKFFECEADKNNKYFRVIQTVREYGDGRRREEENYITDPLAIESVKILYDKLKQIQNSKAN